MKSNFHIVLIAFAITFVSAFLGLLGIVISFDYEGTGTFGVVLVIGIPIILSGLVGYLLPAKEPVSVNRKKALAISVLTSVGTLGLVFGILVFIIFEYVGPYN